MQVDVVPSLSGDAALANAFALHQSRVEYATANSSSPSKACHTQSQAVPVYLHERGFGILTEDHYLVEGMILPSSGSLSHSRHVLGSASMQ